MNKKFWHSFTYYFGIFAITCLAIFVMILHTPFGKNMAVRQMQKLAKTANIEMTSSNIMISFPLHYTFTKTLIQLPNNTQLSIDKMHCKISLLPLLQKKIKIDTFYAEGIHFTDHREKNLSQQSSPILIDDSWISSPYILDFASLEISHLFIDSHPAHIEGSFSFGQNKLHTNLTAFFESFPQNKLQLALDGKKNKTLHVNTMLNLEDHHIFEQYYHLPTDLPLRIDMISSGSWQTYLSQINPPSKKKLSPIKGNITISSDKNLYCKALFSLTKDRLFSAQDFLFRSFYLSGKGSIALDHLIPQKGTFTFEGKNIGELEKYLGFSLSGRTKGDLNFYKEENKYLYSISLKGEPLSVESYLFDNFSGHLEGAIENRHIKGNAELFSYFFNEPLKINMLVDYELSKDCLLKEIAIMGPKLQGKANLTINPKGLLEGKTDLLFSSVNTYFPNIQINTAMECSLEFFSANNIQSLIANALLKNFQMGPCFGDTITLNASVSDLYKHPFGDLTLSMEKAYFKDIFIEKISCISQIEKEQSPFRIEMSGSWNYPITLMSTGWWNHTPKASNIFIDTLTGSMLTHTVQLHHPIDIAFSPENIAVHHVDIALDSAQLLADVSLSQKESDVTVHLENLPADFLALLLLDAGAEGTLSTNLHLYHHKDDLEGQINVSLDNIKLFMIDQQNPLSLNGSFHASIHRNLLDLGGNIRLHEKESLAVEGHIPLGLSLFPFSWHFPQNPIEGSISFEGEIGELSELFNTSIYKIGGYATCDLHISGTYNAPQLEGQCSLREGSYTNYAWGTQLKDIELSLSCDKEMLRLTSFSAHDAKKGSIKGQGLFFLDPQEQFPYTLETNFNDFIAIDNTQIFTKANGNLSLIGTIDKALLEGKVILEDSVITIPSALPSSIPSLDVTFMKEGKEIELPVKKVSSTYPIEFNLHLLSPKDLSIQGQGLRTWWQGQLQILGSLQDPIYTGTLSLDKGDFTFSGRHFDLINGSVTFPGLPHEFPHLMITATLTQKGVKIFADLNGPLDQLHLTFRSTPALPMNALLSLLIFGQEISEISSLQAMQLATSLGNMNKSSPGALENAQKSLGVDRLAIVSPTTFTEEPDQIAVQIGKYVSRDILISFSQGTQQGSSNIILEIDLKEGFSFQIETQQQEEQAKFTLKWGRNF
ncbi:MAG: translocation/assembly module TamB [Parachlamydiales bacterium]|nr:translocation/assembly module TamB [Parachlamydiales bacterium]